MTTYDDNLEKTEQVSTPEFYEVTAGANVYRYTSWKTDLTFLTYEWTKAPIKDSGVITDDKSGVVSTNILFPATTELLMYIANQPPTSIHVKIYRAISDDLSEYVVRISGKIHNIGFKGRSCQVMVKSKGGVLDNLFPRYIYKVSCNNKIFDAGCGLSAATYRKSTTIQSISGSDITSAASGFSQYADGWLTSGLVYVDDYNYRLITAHTGDTISIHVPFTSEVTAGVTVYFLPGCNNGDPALCNSRYNNISDGYNGNADIPNVNPVVWGF